MNTEKTVYNMGGSELRIQTQFGDLVCSVGYDPGYPEFYISLEKNNGVEFTLACIGESDGALKVRVKDRVGDEDFIRCTTYTKDSIQEAYEEVMDECF